MKWAVILGPPGPGPSRHGNNSLIFFEQKFGVLQVLFSFIRFLQTHQTLQRCPGADLLSEGHLQEGHLHEDPHCAGAENIWKLVWKRTEKTI